MIKIDILNGIAQRHIAAYQPEPKKTYQQYMHQLGRELHEATIKGDAALCEEILEEKNRLELYPEDYDEY